jgi:hypothetical protein
MSDRKNQKGKPRGKSYGHPMYQAQGEQRHYLQACVKPDVWAVIQQLKADHGITISGAAHHLMRLGAGLPPLFPFNQPSSDSND